MEKNLGYTRQPGPQSVKFWPIYLCFIIFGILIPFSKTEIILSTLILSILIAMAIGFLAVNMLIVSLKSGNQTLQAENSQFAREAVGTGMLFMIPFTVLAVLAQLLLGWNAVMPFASAAIMTAAATAGTEVMKKGAPGVKNILIPSLIAFIFSTSWMMLVGILP
jgi:hypothetical protein